MSDILYISTIVILAFGLIYGNECGKKDVSEMGCPVFQIDTENHCRTYLITNDGGENFVFYIKPLIIIQKWKLFISLHKRYSGGSSTMINQDLFIVNINNLNRPNTWYKINIRRGKAMKTLCIFQCEFDTYFVEVNGQKAGTYQTGIEAGNEIRVNTVSSLWSFTCDPRQYQPPPQPAEVPQSLPQIPQISMPPAKVPLHLVQPARVTMQPVTVSLQPAKLTTTLVIPTQPAAAHVSTNINECGKKYEIRPGCPVYKIDSQDKCQIHFSAIDEKGNFVILIKSLSKGNLSTSLIRRNSHDYNTPEITNGLFDMILNKADTWHIIKITSVKARKTNCKQQCTYNTYSLEIDDQEAVIHHEEIEAGNEMLVQTSLVSLWSLKCDPRQFQPTPQPTETSLSQTQPLEVTNSATIIPLWQLAIIAIVVLVVILTAVVVLVSRHRRRKCDPELIQPTDNQSGISRQVSDNSLFESYNGTAGMGRGGGHDTAEDSLYENYNGTAGMGWGGGHDTAEDHIYEEINPQGTSTSSSATNSTNYSNTNSDTNSDSNSDNQRKGSAHDSENSLYMGFK